MKRTRERDPIPLATRREVWARSRDLCECGCGQQADHIHHRRLRSQGGTNDPSNLLHLNSRCHQAIHANPAQSIQRGLIVPSWADPAEVPLSDGPDAA